MKALFLNCTLKPSPEKSHTEGLMEKSIEILRGEDIETEILRPVDYNIEYGVQPKMSDNDDWPQIEKKVLAADILVIGTPIWLGEKSSVCTKVIERLYSLSGKTNAHGQYIYYNRVGGAVITGNEDGAKHCGMNILYSLSHLGFVIPPQADTYWVGEAGPGESYLDGGTDNDFTKRNTRIMTWNLIHMARMLEKTPIPAKGNTVEED